MPDSPLFHCIGDSHASFFSGRDRMCPKWPEGDAKSRLPFFRYYRLGPVLAYNLGTPGTASRGHERLTELLQSHIAPPAWLML